MAALFHFVFELLKIAIQAAAYSLLLLPLIHLLNKIVRLNFLKQIKFRSIYLSVYILLLAFSFTYYGNHGLGDEAIVSVGHWETMDSSDGYAFFNSKKGGQIRVDSFLVYKDQLYMTADSAVYNYDLLSGNLQKRSKKDYRKYAALNSFPQENQFKSFAGQYNSYWNGWRFWLLP